MAHSTWFQASTWPSGQPIAPDSSCAAAMVLPVVCISASVSTPGTAGIRPATGRAYGSNWPESIRARLSPTGMRPRGRRRDRNGDRCARRLMRVHDDALADQRVQRPLGEPGHRRVLDDVPDQQPVVGAGQRVAVPVHAHGALQPPVRRVQAVRVVVPADLEPGRAQLGLQLGPGVDADVAARRVVVVVGQPPADPLRQPGGHGHREQPAGPQHPGDLGDRARVERNVFQHLRGDHPVEGTVAERHRRGVAAHRPGPGRRRHLPGRRHGRGHGIDLAQFTVIGVEGDHFRAAPVGLEGMPPGAAAEIQQAVARPDGEVAEINGQQGSAPFTPVPPAGGCPARRAAIARWYSATVARATAGQANRSWTRCQAAWPSRARRSGESSRSRSAAASSSGSPGVTCTAVSPATSGSAPVRLTISGVPDAMCSTAGSENLSYRDGTTATWALAASSASSASLMPCANRTLSPSASSPASRSVGPPGFGLPTTTSCASRSVASLPNARSSVATPLIGESAALATAITRPGTRGAARGWNRRVSTPSGMTLTLPGVTPKSRQMSVAEDWDAVRIVPHRRATLACIRTKLYQRHLESLLSPFAAATSMRRSTLIGWWMLVTSGIPALGSASSP